MVQIPKPVFRLRLGFSGETLLCFANIIHTSTECSFGIVPSGFAHASLSPILAALRHVMAFLHLRLLWLLRHPSTTSITAYPALMQGGWLGLPRSLPNSLHRSLGFSCTPVRCLLTSSSSPASLYLVSHCRFVSTVGLFTVFHATQQLPNDFHPISIVSRMLTLWALLTEISYVTLLQFRLAVWGS